MRNKERQRYEVTLEDEIAYLAYRVNEKVIDMYSTLVPPRFRGKGVAAAIVKRALEDARAEGLKVRPSCSYVDVYIQRHPEYQDLLE